MFIPRTLAETQGPGRRAWARALIVGIFLAVALFAALSVNVGGGEISLAPGDVAQTDIRASRTVSFISESQTEEARQAAADGVEPVYEPISPRADIRDRQLRSYDAVSRIITNILTQRNAGTISPGDVVNRLNDAVPSLTDEQVALVATMTLSHWTSLADAGRAALEAALNGEVREELLAEARQALREDVTSDLVQVDRELAGDLAANQLVANSQVSTSLTEAARQQARAAVEPVVVEVRQGQTVVRAGDPITVLDLEKLDQLGLTRPRLQVSTLAGHAMLAVLMAALLVGFLWRFQPEVWYRNRSLLLFVLALIASALALRVAADRTLWAYIVPSSAAVLVIAVLLEAGSAGAMAVALAVLAGVMNSDAFGPAAYTLAGGIASLVTIAKAERLNVFVRAGAALAVTNIGMLTALGLIDQLDLAGIAQGMAAGAVNAGLSVLLAVGSFTVLGSVFGIMTVFQLLELANPSSRLLRRLLLETPGTYHHSVMVGNLAERAAETIGADPLLARVAAYYHDIGKMKNPLGFIENQAGSRNIHDELDPETSARLIAAHIRDGIDLGYEYGLPVQIIGFIPQHHGTAVMSYFYGKALRELGTAGDEASRDRYRYPGPKPQSREAAILMLSDGVEASVRSMDVKDEETIRGMVTRIVDARVDDGQLDDADLTLRDIARIKEAFVAQLLGMYHSRIKYPDNVLPMEPPRREQA